MQGICNSICLQHPSGGGARRRGVEGPALCINGTTWLEWKVTWPAVAGRKARGVMGSLRDERERAAVWGRRVARER